MSILNGIGWPTTCAYKTHRILHVSNHCKTTKKQTLEKCVNVVNALLTFMVLNEFIATDVWSSREPIWQLSWIILAVVVTHSGSSRDSFWQLSWFILAALLTQSGSSRDSILAALVTHSGSSVTHFAPFKSDILFRAFRYVLKVLKSVGNYCVLLSTMLVFIHEQITL